MLWLLHKLSSIHGQPEQAMQEPFHDFTVFLEGNVVMSGLHQVCRLSPEDGPYLHLEKCRPQALTGTGGIPGAPRKLAAARLTRRVANRFNEFLGATRLKAHINGSTERRILDELMQSASDVQDQPSSFPVSPALAATFHLQKIRRPSCTPDHSHTAGTMAGFIEQ